jgi:hypothetical protein
MKVLRKAAGDGDPPEVRIDGIIALFEADAGTICTAELDGDIDELLKDDFWIVDEDSREDLESFEAIDRAT